MSLPDKYKDYSLNASSALN